MIRSLQNATPTRVTVAPLRSRACEDTHFMVWAAFAEKRTYQFSDTHSPTKFVVIPITYAFKAVPNRLLHPGAPWRPGPTSSVRN
jgi:hypothetical protein